MLKIKNIISFLLFLFIFSFTFSGYQQNNNLSSVIIQFISYNGYGNNLYIDNILIGKRKHFDLAVTSLNYTKDTLILPYNFSQSLIPKATISNLGTTDASNPFTVTMEINSLSYISDTTLSLNAGQSVTVTFDSLPLFLNTVYDFKVYLSNLLDSNYSNDTLVQNTIFLQGADKNLLLEQFTSATSYSCAYNNRFLDSFLFNYNQNLFAVKYHTGFPPPGNDSMYLENVVQNDERISYYFIFSVPTTLIDGKYRVSLPYYIDSNFIKPYEERISVGTPLRITVKDTLINNDTIQATINYEVLYNLKLGNYKLRVYSLERKKTYPQAFSNGERIFYDVFRRAYPDMNGININTNPGNYQITIKYKKEPHWIDSLLYTLVFIQDDLTKEVFNCNISKHIPVPFEVSKKISLFHQKTDLNSKIFNTINFKNFVPKNIYSDTPKVFNYELFEFTFPPSGWKINNPDGWISFEKIAGYNGISFGGSSCMRIPFYDYSFIGQHDTLLTSEFKNVSSEDTLSFDYSYAQYLSGYVDSLIINISIDGGNTFTNIFRRGGRELATSYSTTLPFAPSSSTQWKTFYCPMNAIIPGENISENIPKNYILNQNFPNPFNPETRISYSIPEDCFVTLEIFDILGRKIIILVNEYQRKGNYEKVFIFNDNSFPSGIYFYRLKAKDFVDTKKMILLK